MKKSIVFASLLALGSLAAAQNGSANLDQINQNPTKPIKAEEKAAAEASAAVKVSSEDVTFDQVLQAPDDVELNERFALTQIRHGDLRGASTTLERVLLVDPGRYRTRLLYGVVLTRLDDPADAARALDAVLAVPNLPRAVRDEAREYRAAAASRMRDAHFSARLAFGSGFDDNRNAAPDGDARFFQGGLIPLDPGSRRKDDVNAQFIGTLGADRDFGGPRGDSLFADFTYYRADQQIVHLLDLQVYSPKVGATFRTRWADITPSFSFDHVVLNRGTYMRGRNSDLLVKRRWTGDFQSWFEFTHSYQDFVNSAAIPFASDRTGDQLDWTLGSSWSPTPVDRFSLTLLHRRKYALNVADSAYRRESVGGEWLRLLGRGRFVVMSLTGQFDRYEVPDATVLDGIVRHDDAVTGELLYGQPMDLLWSRLKGFTGTLGYEYFMEHSNVINYDYSNDKLTAMLTYKWGI